MRALLTTALVALLSPAPAQSDIAGPVRVIDGDTIVIAGERIRLHGANAPERDQIFHDGGGTPYRCGFMPRRRLTKN